jgi:uncharacterized protein (DUF305 family)
MFQVLTELIGECRLGQAHTADCVSLSSTTKEGPMGIRHLSLATSGMLLAVLAVLSPPAQTQPHVYTGEDSGLSVYGPAMLSALERLQQGITLPLSGYPDIDFARLMLSLSQGAVDIARLELEHGHDPELRRFAERVIAANEPEILPLEHWLTKRRY